MNGWAQPLTALMSKIIMIGSVSPEALIPPLSADQRLTRTEAATESVRASDTASHLGAEIREGDERRKFHPVATAGTSASLSGMARHPQSKQCSKPTAYKE